MNEVTTMIMAGGRGERLFPLTCKRAKSAIRFGGMYYLIDFTLSNCLNSGLKRIYLLTQYASSSLERHLRYGWSQCFRTGFDEFLETRPPQQISTGEWYSGTADSVYQNSDILIQEKSKATMILSGDHIYKMDYSKMLSFHFQHEADLTIACVDLPVETAKQLGVLVVDGDFRVNEFLEKPENPPTIPGDETKSMCNMGVYAFNTKALIDILKQDAENKESQHDFGRDLIPGMIRSKAKVMAYLFWDENKKESKYWRDIGTIDAYYEASMDLVDIDPLFNLYDEEWPIKYFITNLPPAKTVFNWVGENRIGMALDSLLSPGVIISGGRVSRSILSPKVRVHSYATVSNSILFDEVEIGRGAVVRNAIVDTGVNIPAGAQIGVNTELDLEQNIVSEKGITVVTAKIW